MHIQLLKLWIQFMNTTFEKQGQFKCKCKKYPLVDDYYIFEYKQQGTLLTVSGQLHPETVPHFNESLNPDD